MKKQKEYRSISFSLNDDSRTINGFIPYNDLSEYMGFYERIAPGAFNKTLADGADVRALVEHCDQRLLARTKNGSLHLESREDGLHYSFDAPDTQDGNDILTMTRSGLVNGCSFGFIVINDSYEYIDGKEIRTVLEARLLEVSIVLSEPAYSNTIVYTRSLSTAFEGKETLTEDEQKAAQAEIEKLQSLLPKIEPKVEGPSIEETKQEQAKIEAELKAKAEAEIMQKKATEEELKAQEEAKAKEAEEMQKLYDRLEAASKILFEETT